MKSRLKGAAKAALWHGLCCVIVAAIAATMVFEVWFPHPYELIEGGRRLFEIIVIVDVVCGPALTFVLFDSNKTKKSLFLDLSLVFFIQMVALIYGLHSVYAARPVFLVFEVDRFRVVSSRDISEVNLSEVKLPFRESGFLGPKVIAARVPKPGDADYLQSLDLSLKGVEPALRPNLWRPYEDQENLVKNKLYSLSALMVRQEKNIEVINLAIEKTQLPEIKMGYLPVVGRNGSGWIALVAKDDARVLGFAEVDGF